MRDILEHLFERRTIDRDQASQLLRRIASGEVNDSQIIAFLSVFCMRRITPEELAGFQEAMFELSLAVDLSEYDAIDLCGTGGDGKDTFNISTLAAFVVAAAGVPVTKHGNYGVSSTCGSSNVLEELGVVFTSEREDLIRLLDEAGICFLHAPLFHPAMKRVAPLRRELGVKTFFNILGPLVNPSAPKKQLVGVYNLELSRLYQAFFEDRETRFCIVHSIDGYDEVSLTGLTKVITANENLLLPPEGFGLSELQAEELRGASSISGAAKMFEEILGGQGSAAQEAVVAANAGLALHTARPDVSLKDCTAEALHLLQSGKAKEVLDKVRAIQGVTQ